MVARSFGYRPFAAESWDELTPQQRALLTAMQHVIEHAERKT